jgi:hypothetical protein
MWYKLIAGEIVPAEDVFDWHLWAMKSAPDCRIALTHLGDCEVSTVFIGLDHNDTSEPHTPVLFETMVFGSVNNYYRERCCTLDDAMRQHDLIVARIVAAGVMSKIGPEPFSLGSL